MSRNLHEDREAAMIKTLETRELRGAAALSGEVGQDGQGVHRFSVDVGVIIAGVLVERDRRAFRSGV